MNKFHRRGIVFVVSAPSGAGKSTLCNNLRQTPDFVYSVSCTTREPRPEEREGADYYFLSEKEFNEKVKKGLFLEYAKVHGHWYGTLLSEVMKPVEAGKDVLLEIDVQGARALRSHSDKRFQESLVDVFIMPPTVEELKRRLQKRATEEEAEMERRLAASVEEMKVWPEYKYTLISESVEEDLMKFRAIMRAERYLSSRLTLEVIEEIRDGFRND